MQRYLTKAKTFGQKVAIFRRLGLRDLLPVPPAVAEYTTGLSMGDTAEQMAKTHGISRADQDAFALRSQQRAAAAKQQGVFASEIVAVTVPQRRGEPVLVTEDEHPRPDTTLAMLQKLNAVVKADGTVTAGNASGVNDGACALLLASAQAAKQHGLTPRARIIGTAVAGVAPRIMGFGPAPAVEKVLALTGLTLQQMAVIELNEAFAAQSLPCVKDLGLADVVDDKINLNGGAIALGHPLGCSGARISTTLINLMEDKDATLGLATMCIGLGQGIATVFERV